MTKEELFYRIVINYELSATIEPKSLITEEDGPYKIVYKVAYRTTCGMVEQEITEEEYNMLFEAMKEKADEKWKKDEESEDDEPVGLTD